MEFGGLNRIFGYFKVWWRTKTCVHTIPTNDTKKLYNDSKAVRIVYLRQLLLIVVWYFKELEAMTNKPELRQTSSNEKANQIKSKCSEPNGHATKAHNTNINSGADLSDDIF